MELRDRVFAEWSNIETSDFWRLYKEELAKYRKSKNDKLENCSLEQVQSEQGEILAIKFVMGIPDRIQKSMNENQQEVK